MSLQPGTVIAGRYEVVKCLGAGSMGLVYACRDRELSGHLLAMKVLFPEVAQDKIAVARFRNEIFASYNVSNPNVVRAYDIVRDGDLVGYSMEYVGGGDLADRLGASEPMPIAELVKYLMQMAYGVQAIHEAGIVHRDLKPENILLTKEGNIKIADFGIARTGFGPKLTEHGGVVGTIDYVSPEYMLESQVDWRSDIYAMGILSYEMITGQSPFRGDSVYATMTKRLKADPSPPSSLRPDCPSELDAIVLKAMARNPANRYQSAAEMYYALQEFAERQGVSTGQQLPINRKAISNFSGPKVEEEKAEIRTSKSMEANFEPSTNSPVALASNDNQSLMENPPEILRRFTPHSETKSLEPATRPAKEVVPVTTSDYHEEIPQKISEEVQTFKMESVLSFNGGGFNRSWDEPKSAQVTIEAGKIDRERLTKDLQKRTKSYFVRDMVILSVTVVAGIVIGLIVLNVFFPQFVSGSASGRNFNVKGFSF